LNVCEFPVEEILNVLPLNPAYKNCADEPILLICVMPIPKFAGGSTPPKALLISTHCEVSTST
jgi:hypothetical protein